MACLPPGFHFDPTDEELIVYFLHHKAANLPCSQYPNIIPEIDIHGAEPWELKEKAFMSERGYWYFFTKSKKNPCTKKGIWKELGLDEPIFTTIAGSNIEIGTKKYLVFYADGVQTNWIMEEYYLTQSSFQLGQNQIHASREIWVLCRVHEANVNDPPEGDYYHKCNNGDGVELSCLDEIFYSVLEDDQDEITFPNY